MLQASTTSGTLKCDLVVIVVESDLPGVAAGCVQGGRCIPGGSYFSDDRVDCTATIGHHEHEFNDSRGSERNRHVQIDLRSAGAIRVQAVGAGLTRGEYKPRHSIAVSGIGNTSGHDKIPLRELACAVEVRDGYSSNRALGAAGIRPVPLDRPAIIALESGIATAAVVSSGGHDTQPQHKSRDCERSAQKPRRGTANRETFQIYALHVKSPFSLWAIYARLR